LPKYAAELADLIRDAILETGARRTRANWVEGDGEHDQLRSNLLRDVMLVEVLPSWRYRYRLIGTANANAHVMNATGGAGAGAAYQGPVPAAIG
jgi:hypothetical protein